jgi:hypothetical protein
MSGKGQGITIGKKKKGKPPQKQTESWWLGKGRDGFTKAAEAHQVQATDGTAGVTMAAASKHGTIW